MTTPAILDKGAITLSLVCAIHCLALPLLAVLSPAAMGYFITDEAFHTWLAFIVIPFSLVALTMGCRHHKSKTIALFGLSGMLILLLTALFGHDVLGESGEKIATVVGAALIALAHFRNYRLCQEHQNCKCFD